MATLNRCIFWGVLQLRLTTIALKKSQFYGSQWQQTEGASWKKNKSAKIAKRRCVYTTTCSCRQVWNHHKKQQRKTEGEKERVYKVKRPWKQNGRARVWRERHESLWGFNFSFLFFSAVVDTQIHTCRLTSIYDDDPDLQLVTYSMTSQHGCVLFIV